MTPRTVAHQAPLSMAFSRQEYWSGLPRPPPRDLPNPGMEPASLASPALARGFVTTSATWEAPRNRWKCRLRGDSPPSASCSFPLSHRCPCVTSQLPGTQHAPDSPSPLTGRSSWGGLPGEKKNTSGFG